jgi:hypothetical protein
VILIGAIQHHRIEFFRTVWVIGKGHLVGKQVVHRELDLAGEAFNGRILKQYL